MDRETQRQRIRELRSKLDEMEESGEEDVEIRREYDCLVEEVYGYPPKVLSNMYHISVRNRAAYLAKNALVVGSDQEE